VPIPTECEHCGREFLAPDKYAGRRVKCPRCSEAIQIAGTAEIDTSRQAADEATSGEPSEGERHPGERTDWFLQTDDGEEYGPVSKSELDEWVKEGRVDSSCQVLQEGWQEWKWAEEAFPELARAAGEEQADREQPEGSDALAAIGQPSPPEQQEVNPYVSPPEPAAVEVPEQPHEQGEVSPGVLKAMAQTRPWVSFLSILGFISGGLILLAALAGIFLSLRGAGGFGASGALGALTTLVSSAICLLLAYYLFRYGQHIGRFLRSPRNSGLEAALVAEKSFWKLTGILVAVVFALCVLLLLLSFAG